MVADIMLACQKRDLYLAKNREMSIYVSTILAFARRGFELSPNLGHGRGPGGSGLSLRSDDLDSVGESYTEDDFRQLVVTVETAPAFLGGLRELKDHRERGLVRETPLGAHSAVTHGRERAFDDVGRAQMLPVLGREIVEGEQRVAIP